jgi:hypothetical protein
MKRRIVDHSNKFESYCGFTRRKDKEDHDASKVCHNQGNTDIQFSFGVMPADGERMSKINDMSVEEAYEIVFLVWIERLGAL